RHCDNGWLPRWPDHAFRPDFRLWRADQGRPRRPDPLGALDVFRPDRRPGGVPCGWRHQRVFGRKRVHGGGARNHLRQPERLQPDHRLAGGRRGREQQHPRRSRDADPPDGAAPWARTKTGAGPFTLSGPNPYPGGTTIGGGLINFNAASNFGPGPILLNGGGLQWAAGTSTDISSRLAAFGALGATFDTNGNTVT